MNPPSSSTPLTAPLPPPPADGIPQPEAPSTTTRLIALEGLRFLAMLHIFLFHRFPADSDALPAWFNTIRLNAHYSTSIFFILSGFILAYVYTTPERGLKLKDSDFWSRRFWRVYPIHVIASTVYLPLFIDWNEFLHGERGSSDPDPQSAPCPRMDSGLS